MRVSTHTERLFKSTVESENQDFTNRAEDNSSTATQVS